MRAVTDEEDIGPWSDTGEGRANSPPTVNPGGPEPRALQGLALHLQGCPMSLVSVANLTIGSIPMRALSWTGMGTL